MTKNQLLITLLVLCISTNMSLADYNPVDAIEYVYASALSYCDPILITSWTCGRTCEYLTNYKPFFSQVFIASLVYETLSFSMLYSATEKRVIIAFRGTVGSYELDLENQMDDGIPYTLHDVPNAIVQDYFETRYATILRPVLAEQLIKARVLYPQYEYVFTGHSLGAALATLAAFDALKSGAVLKNQTILYNYGSPRVGNFEFSQAVEETISEIYRVIHWKDYVPHVPLCAVDSTGACVQNMPGASISNSTNSADSVAQWPAWHIGSQVFYTEDSSSYIICEGEDPKCADQFPLDQTTWNDHYVYVGVPLGCL